MGTFQKRTGPHAPRHTRRVYFSCRHPSPPAEPPDLLGLIKKTPRHLKKPAFFSDLIYMQKSYFVFLHFTKEESKSPEFSA
jgi:hypothetical protein